MRILTAFLAFCFLIMAAPLQAQFRSSLRQANKEYELHAYNLAIQNYQQALARRPTDLEALSKIANSFRMLNQMTQAHQYYALAVRDRQVSPTTKLEHAHVLRALGRYDEAKQWYLAFARDHDAVVGNHFAEGCDFAKQQLSLQQEFRATVSSVNSPSAEFGPSFAGQNQLLFSSARTDRGGTFSGQAVNHPFVARFGPGGDLEEPFLLRNGYDGGNVGPVSYSPDGAKVVFTRNNFTDGKRMVPNSGEQLTLWIAEVNPSGQWVNARPVPFNQSGSSTGFGSFSPDGLAIFFASNRSDGYGGYDIYRARWEGNDWAAVPENLGTVINSVGDEITPNYDGVNLYFSSNWHHGMGCFDVFRTEMAAGGRPLTLFHMGNGINSSRDDYGFLYDATNNRGFVVSNRIGGSGNEDLYRITLAGQDVALVIRSATDGQPIANATIDFSACGGSTQMADVNGRFVIQATNGINCQITVNKDGYLPVTVPLQINPNGQAQQIPINLSKVSESYQGRVVNAQSRLAVAGAVVRFVNRGTGNVVEMVTDVNGNYAVAMQPYNTYDISITAPGYEGLNFPLAMADGTDRNVLGVLSLLPGQNIPGTGVTPNPNTGGQAVSGYAVQMASVGKAPDMSAFSSLSDLGQVYSVNTGGSHKIRMGIFQTRAEADQAKAALRQRGYPGAFVVTDSSSGSVAQPSTPPATPTTGTGTTARTGGANGPYYVQLGAYRTPRYFNAAKAQSIGTVVQHQRGDITLMLLNAGADINYARSLQQQAKGVGFDGAFVVQESNGQIIKL